MKTRNGERVMTAEELRTAGAEDRMVAWFEETYLNGIPMDGGTRELFLKFAECRIPDAPVLLQSILTKVQEKLHEGLEPARIIA